MFIFDTFDDVRTEAFLTCLRLEDVTQPTYIYDQTISECTYALLK